MNESESPEDRESDLESFVRSRWKNWLPLTILTVGPTVYLTIKVYLRTSDALLALGSGAVCPFAIYTVINTWLDESSRFVSRSWARWLANRSDERPLLCAIAGAAVFVGFFALLWLAGSAVTGL